MKKDLIERASLFLLFAVIILVGLQAVSSLPLLDDTEQLTHIQGIESVKELFGGDSYGFFRPVKNLIFFTFLKLAPDNHVVWHIITLLFYLITTGLAIFIFSELLNNKLLAVMAGAIWALAPTQISSFVWLSCSNILVMTLALFSALIAYERSQKYWEGDRKNQALILLIVSSAFYMFALFSYESAVIFPALVVLWDWLRGRSFLRSRRHLASYGLFCVLTLIFLIMRQAAVGNSLTIYNESFSPISPLQTSFASAYFVLDHLLLWLWPFGKQTLMAGCFIWGKSATLLQLTLCWMPILLIVALTLRIRHIMPLVSFGFAWFFIAFLPLSNLIPIKNGPFSDYYLVLPSIGLTLAIIGLIHYLATRVYANKRLSRFFRSAALVICILLGCWRIAAATLNFEWARLWNSEIEFFRQSLVVRPYSYSAKARLARSYLFEGKLEKAEALARESISDAPWHTAAHYVLGNIYLEKKLYKEAHEIFVNALLLRPKAPYPYAALGFIHEAFFNDSVKAKACYYKVLSMRWSSSSPDAALNLSRILALEGSIDEAIKILETALKRAPSSAALHHNAAVAYKHKGDMDAAEKHLGLYKRIQSSEKQGSSFVTGRRNW